MKTNKIALVTDGGEFATELMGMLEGEDPSGGPLDTSNLRSVVRVKYGRVGVLPRDAGLVVRMADGSEFQLTIVQSRQARG